MEVKKVLDLPKYMVLAHWIQDQIKENKLKYGEKIYSENELSSMFEISRQTVRQAVGILEQEGYLERRRGSGTYVIYGGEKERKLTRNIGVITTYLDSYIFPSIITGIDKVLSGNGYSMQLALTHNQVENETRALQTMLEKQVDGVIVEPTKSGLPNPNIRLYHQLVQQGIPVLFFNAYYPDLACPHVCMDDHLAGKIATNVLIQQGHRSIAGMFQSDDRQGHLRYAGYVEALQEAGLEVHSSNVLWFATEDIPYLSEESARTNRYIHGCTGLVCYNDEIAYHTVHELQRRGISVPQDLSVVGIDDAELATMCEVPLTTVAHPREELGRVVAQNILRLIDNPEFSATVEFTPRLVVRSSVAAPPPTAITNNGFWDQLK